MEWVDRFSSATFWDELVDYLAENHLIRKFGMNKLNRMDDHTRRTHLRNVKEKYLDEFIKNGLQNLYVAGLDEPPEKPFSIN